MRIVSEELKKAEQEVQEQRILYFSSPHMGSRALWSIRSGPTSCFSRATRNCTAIIDVHAKGICGKGHEAFFAQVLVNPLRLNAERAREDADTFLGRVGALLVSLVRICWISLSDYYGRPWSEWKEQGRDALTVLAFHPLPIQAAQRLGEERYEETVSPWIKFFLRKMAPWIKAFLLSTSISNVYMFATIWTVPNVGTRWIYIFSVCH